MKLPRWPESTWMVLLIIACFALASCGKKITPQQARQSRLDWNMKTLVTAYEQSANTDSAWDEPAKTALTEFARLRSGLPNTNGPSWEIISTNVAAAVHAGCDDPMVNYLFIKYAMSQTNTPKAFADAFCKTADNMQDSSYPNIRQFYASLRAAEQLKYAAGGNPRYPPEVNLYRRQAITNLADALADKNMPVGEVDEACHEMFRIILVNKKQYEDCYRLIEGSLFKNWPDASAVWLIKGEAYTRKAWFARGTGGADEVKPQSWKLFFKDLGEAHTALKKAWRLDPNDVRIPIEMITVAEGEQKDPAEMELWFDRAMTLDPNSYEACKRKLHYLYPQWYGSREDMLEFGRECVTSTGWGGKVPLILTDAHWEYWSYLRDAEVRSNYWKLPDVWPDIKASYDRFFELNPDAIGFYHNYAWYAYRAEQWDALNEIIPKLGPINYSYFGGKDEFDKMIQLAKEHAKPSAAKSQ